MRVESEAVIEVAVLELIFVVNKGPDEDCHVVNAYSVMNGEVSFQMMVD